MLGGLIMLVGVVLAQSGERTQAREGGNLSVNMLGNVRYEIDEFFLSLNDPVEQIADGPVSPVGGDRIRKSQLLQMNKRAFQLLNTGVEGPCNVLSPINRLRIRSIPGSCALLCVTDVVHPCGAFAVIGNRRCRWARSIHQKCPFVKAKGEAQHCFREAAKCHIPHFKTCEALLMSSGRCSQYTVVRGAC